MSLPEQLRERLLKQQNSRLLKVAAPRIAGDTGRDTGISSFAGTFDGQSRIGQSGASQSVSSQNMGGMNVGGMVGSSAGMERLFSQMRSAAPHLRIATIEGEPGTGKSLVAEQLRISGPHRTGNLVRVRACDLNDSVNADDGPTRWSSLCSRARGGTLLIEEAEKLSPSAQMTILNHVEESSHSFTQSRDGTIPMQLLVASARPLRSLVAAGTFSRELAFRLTAMRFVVPPLRERREDISMLADHFIAIYAGRYGKIIRGLDQAALARLLNHDWRGNVRELESVIEAACLEVGGQWIRSIDLCLTPNVPATRLTNSALKPSEDLTLDGAIQRHVGEILTRTRGNKLRTARLLGISRSTLYRMLQPGHAL